MSVLEFIIELMPFIVSLGSVALVTLGNRRRDRTQFRRTVDRRHLEAAYEVLREMHDAELNAIVQITHGSKEPWVLHAQLQKIGAVAETLPATIRSNIQTWGAAIQDYRSRAARAEDIDIADPAMAVMVSASKTTASAIRDFEQSLL